MQKEQRPSCPLLYSLRGFQYCDLLLVAPERAAWQNMLGRDGSPSHPRPDAEIAPFLDSCRALSARAAQTLKWVESYRDVPLLTIALDRLTLGRAALYEAILEGRAALPYRQAESVFEIARRELDVAVNDLRRAGTQNHLPRGLLTRAWCSFAEAMEHRLQGQQQGVTESELGAQEDLDEAWEIAERGPMKLFLADIHLHRARLFFRVKPYPWKSRQDDVAEARKLIEQCGYWRRKEELEDAERAILNS
jgi:hypothetical protein